TPSRGGEHLLKTIPSIPEREQARRRSRPADEREPGSVPSILWCERGPTRTTPPPQNREPVASRVHIVVSIEGNSTRAPKMHIAAAPASRNDPGSKSQAEYQGGWTRSPRSNNRVAPNITAAAATAGAVRLIAQRVPT